MGDCCGGTCGCGSGGGSLQVGQAAPDFLCQAYFKGWEGSGFRELGLADYQGQWLLLFFYPLDFTLVCQTEIRALSEAQPEFQARNCEVLGASTDSQFSHRAWVGQGELGELQYPLLADFTKEVAARYGVLDAPRGFALRSCFLVSPEGRLKYACVHDIRIGHSVPEILRVLDALQSGDACPANWQPGDQTL